MKLIDTNPQGYRFATPGGEIFLPRVSRILDVVHGPMIGDPEVLANAATFGTAVHAGLAGEETLLETIAHTNQGRKMLLESQDLKPVAIEQMMYYLGEPVKFAGRPDLIAEDRFGFPGILDWKTGALSKRHRIAINLYSLSYFRMTGIRLRWQKLVHLESKRYQVEDVPLDWGIALRTLTEYQRKGVTI